MIDQHGKKEGEENKGTYKYDASFSIISSKGTQTVETKFSLQNASRITVYQNLTFVLHFKL